MSFISASPAISAVITFVVAGMLRFVLLTAGAAAVAVAVATGAAATGAAATGAAAAAAASEGLAK
jgi:hypothetical protein